jgi:aminoglycoside 3-N-acetyltransferase
MGRPLPIPSAVKRLVREQIKVAWRAYVRTLYSFNGQDFRRALKRVGVRPGDVLMVHSSFDRFEGFLGTPTEAIQILQESVSPDGTVMMPTMPFSGSAHDWVQSGRIMDVRRTPSRMGLLTELFRRSQGVVRTVHPTHPVAIWGAKALELSRDAHQSTTPCGRPSPFARLLEVGGKSLLLGTNIEALTFFHSVEEILEPDMPFSPFTNETFDLQTRDDQGSMVLSRLRLFDRHYSSCRRVAILVPELKRRGEWHEVRIGRLSILLLSAAGVLGACRSLASRGVYCYSRP